MLFRSLDDLIDNIVGNLIGVLAAFLLFDILNNIEITHLDSLLRELMEVLLKLMEENTETYMPGFTYLQMSLPMTLA